MRCVRHTIGVRDCGLALRWRFDRTRSCRRFSSSRANATATAVNVARCRPAVSFSFTGRGHDHMHFLLDEVAPLLVDVPHAYVLDADAGLVHSAKEPHRARSVEEVPALIEEAAIHRRDSSDDTASFCEAQARAFDDLPSPDEVEAYLSSPTTKERIADAAARVEAAPLRLWEAMLWRGHNYRWELVAGEVPLVGELWSELAANRTLLRCVEDAERGFGAGAFDEGGWIRCGSARMRQRGTQVEIRFRPSAADRLVAFAPHARLLGEDAVPSLLGVLLAGGENGKTEMLGSYTESIAEVPPRVDVAEVAHTLADEIRRWVGANVVVSGEADRAGSRWPEKHDDATWHVHHWKRWVAVFMPLGRASHLPWDIQAGLHLSDEFLLHRMRR